MDDEEETSGKAGKKTIEHWATAKGYLPREIEVKARTIGQRQVTDRRGNPDFWKFRVAQAKRGWPEGKEVTEQEFDEAVAEATGIQLR